MQWSSSLLRNKLKTIYNKTLMGGLKNIGQSSQYMNKFSTILLFWSLGKLERD